MPAVFMLTVAGTILFRSFLSGGPEDHIRRQICDFADIQELYFHSRMTVLHDYIEAFSSQIELMRNQGYTHRDIRNEIQRSILYVRFLYSEIVFKSGAGFRGES